MTIETAYGAIIEDDLPTPTVSEKREWLKNCFKKEKVELIEPSRRGHDKLVQERHQWIVETMKSTTSQKKDPISVSSKVSQNGSKCLSTEERQQRQHDPPATVTPETGKAVGATKTTTLQPLRESRDPPPSMDELDDNAAAEEGTTMLPSYDELEGGAQDGEAQPKLPIKKSIRSEEPLETEPLAVENDVFEKGMDLIGCINRMSLLSNLKENSESSTEIDDDLAGGGSNTIANVRSTESLRSHEKIVIESKEDHVAAVEARCEFCTIM